MLYRSYAYVEGYHSLFYFLRSIHNSPRRILEDFDRKISGLIYLWRAICLCAREKSPISDNRITERTRRIASVRRINGTNAQKSKEGTLNLEGRSKSILSLNNYERQAQLCCLQRSQIIVAGSSKYRTICIYRKIRTRYCLQSNRLQISFEMFCVLPTTSIF